MTFLKVREYYRYVKSKSFSPLQSTSPYVDSITSNRFLCILSEKFECTYQYFQKDIFYILPCILFCLFNNISWRIFLHRHI